MSAKWICYNSSAGAGEPYEIAESDTYNISNGESYTTYYIINNAPGTLFTVNLKDMSAGNLYRVIINTSAVTVDGRAADIDLLGVSSFYGVCGIDSGVKDITEVNIANVSVKIDSSSALVGYSHGWVCGGIIKDGTESSITIHDCHVNSEGVLTLNSDGNGGILGGINGGNGHSCGNITIYGCTARYTDISGAPNASVGAIIGGYNGNNSGICGDITIRDCMIDCSNNPIIMGGLSGYSNGNCGNIQIYDCVGYGAGDGLILDGYNACNAITIRDCTMEGLDSGSIIAGYNTVTEAITVRDCKIDASGDAAIVNAGNTCNTLAIRDCTINCSGSGIIMGPDNTYGTLDLQDNFINGLTPPS